MSSATQTAAQALAMLKRSGTTYTLTRATQTANASEPWKIDSTATAAETVYGVLVDFTASERDGDLVQQTDRRYLVAASGITNAPEPGDTLTDSDAWAVVAVQEIRKQATAVAYYLHVRR